MKKEKEEREMQNVLKSKILIGAILAAVSVTAAVIIAVNAGHSGNDLQTQLDLGNKYVSELDYENAIIAYEEALEIDPYCLEAYLGLADAYMALGQQDKAIEIMEQAKSMMPDSVEVYVSLAQLYASRNEIGLVVSTLEEGIRVTDSDRLREMLQEYQTDGPQLAEAETGNEPETAAVPEAAEAEPEEEAEEENDASLAIGLRQDRNQQNTELVLTVSQDNGEVAEIPLAVPVLVTDNEENDSSNYEENQDSGQNNDGGSQGDEPDSGNQEDEPDSGSDTDTDDEPGGIVSPVLPRTGVTGNVYGINGQGIEGVTVSLYLGQSQSPVTVSTDTLGNYVQGLSAGTYRIVLSKEGYTDLSTSVSVVNNALTSSSYIMLTSEESRQSASFKGIAINATDSQKIEGVTIALLNGFDSTSSANPNGVQGSAVTGTNGECAINDGVNAGYYTIEASKDGYSTYHHNETIKPGENELTINMSPVIQVQGEYRIVLTWGETPRDLDSHLICSGNENYHIYYARKDYNSQNTNTNSAGYASLDVDDISSYGPETTTVKIGEGNSYIYAVHNYSDGWTGEGGSGAWNLAHSGARVVVYSSDGIIFDGSVPTNEQGITWEVFRIENGRLNVTNRISFDYPGESSGNIPSVAANDANAGSPIALASLEDETAESQPCEIGNTLQAVSSPMAAAAGNDEESAELAASADIEAVLENSEETGEEETAEDETGEEATGDETAEEGNDSTETGNETGETENTEAEEMEESGETADTEEAADAGTIENQDGENTESEEAENKNSEAASVPEGVLPSGNGTENKENEESESPAESKDNGEDAQIPAESGAIAESGDTVADEGIAGETEE